MALPTNRTPTTATTVDCRLGSALEARAQLHRTALEGRSVASAPGTVCLAGDWCQGERHGFRSGGKVFFVHNVEPLLLKVARTADDNTHIEGEYEAFTRMCAAITSPRLRHRLARILGQSQ